MEMAKTDSNAQKFEKTRKNKFLVRSGESPQTPMLKRHSFEATVTQKVQELGKKGRNPENCEKIAKKFICREIKCKVRNHQCQECTILKLQ